MFCLQGKVPQACPHKREGFVGGWSYCLRISSEAKEPPTNAKASKGLRLAMMQHMAVYGMLGGRGWVAKLGLCLSEVLGHTRLVL